MRTQLLQPFLADDFKFKLLKITCHVVRSLFASRCTFAFLTSLHDLTKATWTLQTLLPVSH